MHSNITHSWTSHLFVYISPSLKIQDSTKLSLFFFNEMKKKKRCYTQESTFQGRNLQGECRTVLVDHMMQCRTTLNILEPRYNVPEYGPNTILYREIRAVVPYTSKPYWKARKSEKWSKQLHFLLMQCNCESQFQTLWVEIINMFGKCAGQEFALV